MKHIYKTFWARQIAIAIYGFLAITTYMLHDIENTYSSMSSNIDIVMEKRLSNDDSTDVAFIKPQRKPGQGQFDIASMQ